MSINADLAKHVEEILDRIREPMGLDRWQIEITTGECKDEVTGEPCTGAAMVFPEYSTGRIVLDFECMKTGDDVEELVVHEATHFPVWWIHAVAEHLADAWANSAPDTHRESIRSFAQEQVRVAAEKTTTDLGNAFLRLFRRNWVLETEVKQLRADLKAARKQAPPTEK